ncbi:MAG: electron transfer flavoprotein subunit beta/FixA family protein [Deltaproteobacteria bacterium]|nr:electron transfer flavoprotein subunit beta/FixA family protein [Deltaproteobacteria bacterium]
MPLNIIICIKAVVLEAPDGKVIRTSETCALNPFDRPAIEMAIRLRDEAGGTVTAVSMGPESGSLALYEALAMGVDHVVLVSDPSLAGSDTFATSTVLSAAIRKLAPFDLLLFGTRTSDSDTGQVGPQTSVLLDIPLVTGVTAVTRKKANFIVERKIDEFIEEYEVALPGALTIHASALQPRDASLMGLETAYGQEQFTLMTLKDLDILAEQVGDNGSPTKIINMQRIQKKRKCEMIQGSVEEQAEELVRRLKEAGHIG